MEFAEYAHEQRPALLRFATILTGQTWLAEDLVSDVLGRAFERWDRIGSTDQPNAYVRRMIVNDHVSWRRRIFRRTPAADIESRDDGSQSDLTSARGATDRPHQRPREPHPAGVPMSNLHTLSDAFTELERRADAIPATADRPTEFRTGRRRTRMLAPALAAAAVIATATGIAVWPTGGDAPSGRQAGQPVHSATAPASHTVSNSAKTRTSSAAAKRYHPPASAAALIKRARQILDGTATIRVTERDEPDHGSGPVIVGTLTAHGDSGGFDLLVSAASPSDKAECEMEFHCRHSTLANGDDLAVGKYTDPQVPGGVTYVVDVVRTDGAMIRLHLSNQADPKRSGPITAPHVPLTVQQMTHLVDSPRW